MCRRRLRHFIPLPHRQHDEQPLRRHTYGDLPEVLIFAGVSQPRLGFKSLRAHFPQYCTARHQKHCSATALRWCLCVPRKSCAAWAVHVTSNMASSLCAASRLSALTMTPLNVSPLYPIHSFHSLKFYNHQPQLEDTHAQRPHAYAHGETTTTRAHTRDASLSTQHRETYSPVVHTPQPPQR